MSQGFVNIVIAIPVIVADIIIIVIVIVVWCDVGSLAFITNCHTTGCPHFKQVMTHSTQ